MASLRASLINIVLACHSESSFIAGSKDVKVSYLHEERWQLQVYARAGLHDPPGKTVRRLLINRRISWWTTMLVSFRWQQMSNMDF